MAKNIKNQSDEELVGKVRDENQELFKEVVRRYEDKLLRYAKYLIADADKAADVVQNAFIKAFVNLRAFDIRKKFSSWMYRIVHNEAINIIRKEKKEVSLEAFEWSEQFFAQNDSSEERLQEKDLQKMVHEALEELPLKYREPITLYYVDNVSYEDIHKKLGLPIGTVGTRINRGKAQLKKIITRKMSMK